MNPFLTDLESTLKSLTLHMKDRSSPLLFEAVSHVLLNPGKRLRPLLVFTATESLGGDPKQALLPAAAIEILHTYSLVHDDLPCMDDDDLRRGKPTLHKLYGEGQAVLVGDLLLTLAFEVLATTHLPPAISLRLIQLLAQKSGGEGMILGQSLDLAAEGKTLSWDELSFLHSRKTADLIGCCLQFAAVLSNASPHVEKTLFSVGEKVGLSFQIIDDILDVEGCESKLGKPLFSDAEKDKKTSVDFLGVKGARQLADRLLALALQECKDIGLGSSPLAELLPKLVHRLY